MLACCVQSELLNKYPQGTDACIAECAKMIGLWVHGTVREDDNMAHYAPRRRQVIEGGKSTGTGFLSKDTLFNIKSSIDARTKREMDEFVLTKNRDWRTYLKEITTEDGRVKLIWKEDDYDALSTSRQRAAQVIWRPGGLRHE